MILCGNIRRLETLLTILGVTVLLYSYAIRTSLLGGSTVPSEVRDHSGLGLVLLILGLFLREGSDLGWIPCTANEEFEEQLIKDLA